MHWPIPLLALFSSLFFTTEATFFDFNLLDPDETRSFEQLVESRGFKLKTYDATTKDGYILTVFRILSPDYETNPEEYSKKRKPVIAWHGLMSQGTIFFINSPPDTNDTDSKYGNTFGFALMNTGKYDLWVGNARGNGLSNRHTEMTDSDPQFWNFTYEQIGLYDYPAVLELVLNDTGHSTVAMVGWSQGGQSLFPLLSLQPEYAKYIKPFVGWGVPSYMRDTPSPVMRLFQLFRPLLESIQSDFILMRPFINALGQVFCRPPLLSALCNALFFELTMGSSISTNTSRVPVFFHFFPAPIGNRQLAHELQNGANGRYARYDEDFESKSSNHTEPAEYPLEKIDKNFTALMIYGETDGFMRPIDSEYFVKKMNNLGFRGIKGYKVPKEQWSHFDMIVGMDAGKLVYDQTIDFINEHA